MIKEMLSPEETKQKHESSGSSSSADSSSSMETEPLLETLKKAEVLRAIVLKKENNLSLDCYKGEGEPYL